ncbi:MAG TPA: hypothetical protein VG710_17205, partial [Opitutus sp.]|nr:hypothetical protein [Opitutus sp.]
MKLKKIRGWTALLAAVCAGAPRCACAAEASSFLTVDNGAVRVRYDLGAGTFDIVDPRLGIPAIAHAHTAIEQWSSTDPACRRSGEITRTGGEPDATRKLTVACRWPDGTAVVSEFTLRAGDSGIELRAAFRNRTGSPQHIREFHPLAGGAVFPGSALADARTLNGDSSCAQAEVTPSAYRESGNNLLLTFKLGDIRHSIVLGALRTEDFTKWMHLSPEAGRSPRATALDHLLPGARLVAYLGGRGAVGHGPTLTVIKGKTPVLDPAGSSGPLSTITEGDQDIVVQATGLDPTQRYVLGLSWHALWEKRPQSVTIDGPDGRPITLLERQVLPTTSEREPGREFAFAVPPAACATGPLRLHLINGGPKFPASFNEIWLWQVAANFKLAPDWSQGRRVSTDSMPDSTGWPVQADIEAADPAGRLVDSGEFYDCADSFYLDCGTADPFAALEHYAARLREATGARPHLYDFPTECAWYIGVWHTPGAQNHPDKSLYRINTTAGLVEELDHARARGFLDYSRIAERLVPDTYRPINPQGWWDDEHWRLGGYYTAPYDTSAAYGRAAHERGGLAFTYIQPTCVWAGTLISEDFRRRHANWLCGRDPRRTLDYTIPAVQDYLRHTFGALRGHIDGLMVDYCDSLWTAEAAEGGFADSKTTGTAFYRTFFRLVKAGLGPDSWLHERNLYAPDNDLTLGYTDSQRLSSDTDKITPDMVTRGGLRWYKNRVLLSYDMDSKDLNGSWKVPGYGGSDRDGRRMMLTMACVAASRLIVANSLRDLSPEALHDFTRTFPYPTRPQSARPIDAFATDGWPRTYDFAVNPRWHELTLYNDALPTRPMDFAVRLDAAPADGGPGLASDRDYYIYDFWNDRLVGRLHGTELLRQTLRPGEARMLSIHEVEPHPQFLSTNRHLMQGYLDLARYPEWSAADGTLRGAAKAVRGDPYEIVLALNGYRLVDASASGAEATLRALPGAAGFAVLRLEAAQTGTVDWQVRFGN